MLRRRRAQQLAVEPFPRIDQVEKVQLRQQAKLEGGIAELHVEIDQAGFATDTFLVLGDADRELGQQRGRADAAVALDDADHLAVRRVRGRRVALDLIPDRRSDVSSSAISSGSGTTSCAPARTSARTSASGGS